jgi:hypothetical protein
MQIKNTIFKKGRSKNKRKRVPQWRKRIRQNYSPKKCNTFFLVTTFILMPLLLQAREFDLYPVLTGRKEHDLYAAGKEKREQDSYVIPTIQMEFESFTIQTGSFLAFESAQKHFDSIVQTLDEKGLAHLRIEKIGKYYAVRLGKFKDRISAENYVQTIEPELPGSIVLRARVHDERIIDIYTAYALNVNIEPETPSLSPVTPEESENEELPEERAPNNGSEEPPEIVQNSNTSDSSHTAETETANIVSDVPDQNVQSEIPPPVTSEQAQKVELQKKPYAADEKSFLEKIKGRVYVSDYYSVDGGDYNFHILTARLNVYKLEEKKPGIFFEFDGRARKKIFNGDLRANVPEYKISEVWLGYVFPGQKWKAIAGRQYINQLYNTYLDGLNVNYSFKEGLGVGVFGGLAPDKYDDSFSTKFRSAGIYGFLDRTDHKISLGYENLTYDGETDREYFSIRVYSKLDKKFRLNALSSVTKNQITNKPEMENANVNLLYSHSRKLRFNVFFNYYRTIKYFESSKYYFEFSDLSDSYFLDNNSQTRTGARVDYKILKGLKIYASTSYQKRTLDNEDAIRFTGGIRKYDIYGFDLSARYTYLDGYSSKSSEYNIELHRNIMKKFDVSAYVSREEEKLNLENAFTSGAFTYGGSLYWPITKKIFLSMFVERIDEEDYENTSFFSQLGYKF